MGVLTSAKKSKLNRMNVNAKECGLGDLINPCVVAAGTHTTAGGDATESITVSDCASGDIAIVTMKTTGASPVTITKATAGSGAITVTLSADPSTDHVLQYVVLRSI